MNIKVVDFGLPWKLKEVLRSMRRDLADSRRTMAELLQMMSALELRHGEATEELRREMRQERSLRDWNASGDGNRRCPRCARCSWARSGSRDS